jgi:hypothetical protein
LKKILIILLFIGVILYAQTTNNLDNIMPHLSIGNQYNTLTQGQGNFEWYYPYSYTQHYFFGFDGYSNAILSESEYYARERLETIVHWTLRLFSRTGDRYITFGGGQPENINSIENAKINYNMSNGRLSYWSNGDRESTKIEYRQNNEIYIVTRSTSDGTMPPNLFCYTNISREELFGKYLKLYLDGIDYILDKKWETRIKGIASWSEKNIPEKRYDNDASIIESLNGRTARELAIFRNYIYARHNYRFRSDEWNIFLELIIKTIITGIKQMMRY